MSFAPGQFMPWAVDHGLSLNPISISNFSHFQHLHQNHIHEGHHENLQLLSAPEQCRMERKLGKWHQGSMES